LLYKILTALLITAGLFIILKIRPADISQVLLIPFEKKRILHQRITKLTGKKSGPIRRRLNEAQQMLDSAGMSEQISSYKWLAVILALPGLIFGLAIDNLPVAIVLATGLAAAPLAIIRIRTGEYVRGLNARLETGMGLITNSYLQSGDLTSAVSDNLKLLPAPLDNIFGKYLVETQFIDASNIRAIELMRERVNNRYWRDWCSVLNQCQHDRQLRFALPGIVERLGETRRAQMEIDTVIQKHFGDFLITVLIVLGSIPMMSLMMPDWYEMLMHTTAGKITLTVVLAAVLSTALWVAGIYQPHDIAKDGDVIC
jgi:tight adherence protein B